MISFLNYAHQGISMNALTFRKQTIIYHSDASEFGIGGYNITSGNAWCFKIPVDCHLRASLNSLEFLSCMITFWVDTISSQIDTTDCLLCQTDSSTASGWLRTSNFAEKKGQGGTVDDSPSASILIYSNTELPVQSMVSGGGQRRF